jgi:hypothetical protein
MKNEEICGLKSVLGRSAGSSAGCEDDVEVIAKDGVLVG